MGCGFCSGPAKSERLFAEGSTATQHDTACFSGYTRPETSRSSRLVLLLMGSVNKTASDPSFHRPCMDSVGVLKCSRANSARAQEFEYVGVFRVFVLKDMDSPNPPLSGHDGVWPPLTKKTEVFRLKTRVSQMIPTNSGIWSRKLDFASLFQLWLSGASCSFASPRARIRHGISLFT